MDKVITWIKENMILALGIGLALIIMLFGKGLKKMFGGSPRRRHRRIVRSSTPRRPGSRTRTNRKPIPRSVGMNKRNGYPKAGGGIIPFKRNKDGSIKKAWQVAGTVAAKNRMSKLRKNR